MTFETISSDIHANWYNQVYNDIDSRYHVLDNWAKQKSENTINYWLHQRMFSLTDVLAKPNTSWLTVGDGYGFDANYLREKKCVVVASDIANTFLATSKLKGLIEQFSIENVEKLTFKDNSFDYSLCKEAFHHFPRPMIGVYEMLRVSKKAVIFIEPQDPISRLPLLVAVRNILDNLDTKMLHKIWKNRYSFETVGNYVYKMSEREMEKVAMGLNLPGIAFKGLNNNYYYPQNKDEKADISSKFFKKIMLRLKLDNFLTKATIKPYQTLCAVIFKELPTDAIIDQLKKDGFRFYKLPKNPYI